MLLMTLDLVTSLGCHLLQASASTIYPNIHLLTKIRQSLTGKWIERTLYLKERIFPIVKGHKYSG